MTENEFSRNIGIGVPDPQRHNSEYTDHVSHSRSGFKVFPDKLYVITPVSNTQRYRVRYDLYRAFEAHIQESGAILITVEKAFGGRPFELTQPNNPYHVQVRGEHELWDKENLINIGFSHIIQRFPDVKYIAWVDADVKFTRPDWVQETIQQLQHYQIVQMWSQIQDVSPDYELVHSNYPNSWCYNWCNGRNPIKLPGKNTYPYPGKGDNRNWYGPPGLAWAARREALDALGGLIDWGIVGSSDAYMAACLIGGVQYQLLKTFNKGYKESFMIWQDRAERHIRRNIGYVPGLALHYWHGNKKNRRYIDRNQILVKNNFNPNYDLKKDIQGLWQLVDHGDLRSIELRDALRKYFKQRNEDSIDVE